jgi:uncharacterized RDD family membrane protein YckC
MKCPKCQYISFDSGDRCRNCGYDFSLAEHDAAPPDVDLPIQNGTEPVGPLTDLSLHDTGNLPLFHGDARDHDAPLVAAGAAPRAPLAVRRAAPAVPRPRPRREPPPPEPRLALDTADLGPPIAVPLRDDRDEPVVERTRAESEGAAPVPAAGPNIATIGARVSGGAVDIALLGAIDMIVLYFTLRICDLTFAQAFAIPLAPFMAFLAILNGGYLAAFVAANGQTIGKMAARTRVISADPALNERVTFEQAVLRAAASVISALPLGLGFLPVLFGDERRALHDRLADTRVVKA